jgi:hypothetical protein
MYLIFLFTLLLLEKRIMSRNKEAFARLRPTKSKRLNHACYKIQVTRNKQKISIKIGVITKKKEIIWDGYMRTRHMVSPLVAAKGMFGFGRKIGGCISSPVGK